MASLRFWIRAITLAMASLVAVALILRAARNDYAFYLAYLVFQYVALALGWNILGGYAGFVNFGASAFFAAGAYATVALHKTIGASLPFCVAAGGAVGATLGLLMGALTLRLRGVYFAISTLSLSMVLETLVVNWSYVGGSSGAYLDSAEGLRALHDLHRISLPDDVCDRGRRGRRLCGDRALVGRGGPRGDPRRRNRRRRARRPDVAAQARCGDDQRRDPRHDGDAAAVLQFLSQPRLRLRHRLFGQRHRHGAWSEAWKVGSVPSPERCSWARSNSSRWLSSRPRRAWR